MKNLSKIIFIFLLFFAQTAFPFNTQLFAVNLSPLVAYLIATAFVLPTTESFTILVIISLLYYLTEPVFFWLIIILSVFTYLVVKIIRKHSTSSLLSYGYIFLTIIIYQMTFDLIYFVYSNLGWSKFGDFFINFVIIEVMSQMVMTLLFIALLNIIQPKKL